MPEEMLVETCSPVLAGLKTANLFSIPYKTRELLRQDLQEMNLVFVRKGLRAVPLGRMRTRELLYIYRPDYLDRDMSNATAKELLASLGYSGENPDALVAQLGKRFRERQEFPHEIGLFLGYPAEDVKQYIAHKGRDCKCTGYWKVYTDEAAALQTFRRYRSCTNCYRRDWKSGVSIDRLTVKVGKPLQAAQ